MSSASTTPPATPTPATPSVGVARFANAREWLDALGDVPLERILFDPPPGMATEADVVRLDDQHKRLCELIDGTLVEKTVGYIESLIASNLIFLLNLFVKPKRLGRVAAPDGMIRMPNDRIRIPDVAFYPDSAFPGGKPGREAAPQIVPDLAVEILSPSNTKREMSIKLAEYFEAGTRLVWYVDPPERTVTVFRGVNVSRTLTTADRLTAEPVLDGFDVAVVDLFEGT